MEGDYLSPMMTRRGSVITERASCSTAAGMVALKRDFWTFSAVQAARISSVCSRSPSSNSLSASSRTRCFTLPLDPIHLNENACRVQCIYLLFHAPGALVLISGYRTFDIYSRRI